MNYKTWAILSGFFFAINLVFDGFNLRMIFNNIYVYAFLGGWIAVILTFIIAFFFGKKFDKGFKKVGDISRKGIKYAVLAGTFAAAYTFFLLYLIKRFDPSTISALIPFTLIFLIIRDFFYTKERPSFSEYSNFLMIFVGAILISFNGSSFNWKIFFLAGILLNIINAFYSHFMKLGMSKSKTDALNFRLMVTIVLAICFTFYTLPHLNFNSLNILLDMPLLTASMFFAFLGYISYLVALKNGKVSIVSGLNLSYLGFAFIITFLLNLISPKIFKLGFSNTFWIMKFLGIVLVSMATLSFLLTEISTLLVIKIDKRKKNGIVKQLLRIKEVKSLVYLKGKYSLGITVISRDEKKLKKIIQNRIFQIGGIKKLKIFNKD